MNLEFGEQNAKQRIEADSKEVKKRVASIERQIEATRKKLQRLRTAWLDGDYDEDRSEYDAAKERVLHQLEEQKKLLRECVTVIPEVSEEYLAEMLGTLSEWGSWIGFSAGGSSVPSAR